MQKFRYLVLPALLLLLAVIPGALAHKPLWGKGDQIEIPDLTTSFAAYRTLEEAGQIDVFVIDEPAGTLLRGEINIPQIEGLEDYHVRAALFGPGLPEADPAQLPAAHPETPGALIFPSQVSPDFFEPFTQTRYWGRQQIDTTLPETAEYYLLVWQPEGKTGKYILATGREERFAATDLLRFPVWWVRVQLFFNQAPYLVLGAILLFTAATAGLLFWRQKTDGQGAPVRKMED